MTDIRFPASEMDFSEDWRLALDRWRSGCGMTPASETAPLEAAALARVVPTPEGPAFDPAAFGELVEFIAEMPF